MKLKALFFASTALAALTAMPSLAQSQQISIIALQANVDNAGRKVTYGIRPNSETIPLEAGQRIRVSLVGTAIINGVGVERTVNARFHTVAGAGALELGQTGPNWVMVRGRGNGVAQLGYDVTDRSYAMKGGFESGRITFQMTGSSGAGDNGGNGGYGGGAPPPPSPAEGGDRLAVAQRIAQRLYHAILNKDDLRDARAQRDIDAIYRGGFPVIQSVARDLAIAAEANGRFDQRNADDVVGRFYRDLLGRRGSNREIANQDRGFLDNVNLLRERGLPELVRVIVGSQEFQQVQELDRYGLLYAPNDRERGRDGRDYRRPPR